MFEIEQQDGIAIVHLRHGPANAMDVAFCNALTNGIKELEQSDSQAIILTGQGSIFSAGVDLPLLLEGGVDYIRQFLPALGELLETAYFCSKPLITAINGHAIAGGCLLACAADKRLMATGKARFGVPELHVGVPFPVTAMELMRAQVAPRYFEEIMLGGATYKADDALQRGLIDKLVEPDELMEHALEAAKALSSIRPAVYALAKRQARQPVRTAIDMQSHLHGARINELWESEETLEAIRGFVAKTLKK